MTTWNKQIENRNFLSPIGFKFLLAEYPKIPYFAQSANIPSMNLGIQQQSTPLRQLPLEGFITYDPLNLTFLIDEDMENYMILHNWIRALGTPDTYQERGVFTESKKKQNKEFRTDATLAILNSNFNLNLNCVFQDIIPQSLSAMEFNATIDGTEYATASVSFTYAAYQVRRGESTTRDTRLE
jgi:hypothetical protein